jgi:Ca2+-binding EF-hand superfamily protein
MASASVRTQFENEVRLKLAQRSTSYVSEETLMLRSFKYFDLDNSGMVSLEEWMKAIEKIGVVVTNAGLLEELFHAYDTSGDGELDYQEFIASVFGANSATAKRMSPSKLQPQEQQHAEEVLENVRTRLASRGTRGILGLARQFKIMDDDNSKNLDFYEFSKAMKDYRIDMPEADLQLVFNSVDRNRSGTIDYDEFLRAVRGPMNNFRKALVAQAFNKLDIDGNGHIDYNDVKQIYNAKGHPDVRSGKKTEEEILGEFLETFEMHHNILGGNDRVVTKEEFEEYYNNVSASVDNDQYFELMMNNAWKLTEPPAFTRNKAWTNKAETQGVGSRPAARGGEEAKAPAAMASGPRQVMGKGAPAKLRSAAPQRTAPVEEEQPSVGAAPIRGGSVEALLDNFRSKLAARGTRGILGLARQFKIMDDDNSKNLSMEEFRKACKDYRIDMSDTELNQLYRAFDRDRSGTVDYDELLRGVRGPMNSFRRNLVGRAWNKLNRDGNDVINIEDIRGVYDPKNHPDVRSGKKTQDEVLNEFLETFELHHNISDRAGMDHNVTREEFDEYYNNVSASVDDDRYFDLMITNAWKLNGPDVKREAWASTTNAQEFGSRGAAGQRARPQGASAAPYGVTDAPTDYSTNLRPSTAAPRPDTSSTPAGTSTYGAARGGARQGTDLIQAFRERLLARGARGLIGLARSFKIMDDNDSKTLELSEFIKALRDFRVDLDDADARTLFNYFDASHDGSIDYEEFLHRVRGPMNDARKRLVARAFQKLDKNSNGTVELDDIRGVYNAKFHPDVKSGKKTEDEILGEFLDTFEMHHSIFVPFTQVGGTGRDKSVTMDEFNEYYNHISASIGAF